MTAKRLSALDGLRGIAALVVVAYHTLRMLPGFPEALSGSRPSGAINWVLTVSPARSFVDGALAVWLFFVLSGFVLSRSFWEGRPARWKGYYARRAIRLYTPVIASAGLALVLLALQQFLTTGGRSLVDLRSINSSWSTLAANLSLVNIDAAPLNGVWWSMRWEVWFSILLPVVVTLLAIFGCGRRRRHQWAPVVFGALCFSAITFQPWLHQSFDFSDDWNRALLYLPMFGVGITLGAFEVGIRQWNALHRGPTGWWILAGAIALLSVRGPIGLWHPEEPLVGSIRWGLINASSMLGVAILIGLFVGWLPGIRALSVRPIAWLGTRSYSLYLVHLPVLHLFAASLLVEGMPFWFFVLVIGTSLGLCALFYRFVEAPSIALASRLTRHHRRDLTSGHSDEPSERIQVTVG